MGGIDIEELIRELLALKVSNEDLTKRVEVLERKMESVANGPQDLYGKGYLR